MPVPSPTQLATWSAAVNKIAPWCVPNSRTACYTLAQTIATASAPSDVVMLDWASRIWDFAATFGRQRWEYANTTATHITIQAGGETAQIVLTGELVAAGMDPTQARAVAGYLVDATALDVVDNGDGTLTFTDSEGGGGVVGVTKFDFAAPASTWTVSHGLGRYPLVQVHDASGTEFDADVELPDLNTAVIVHAAPRTGFVLVG